MNERVAHIPVCKNNGFPEGSLPPSDLVLWRVLLLTAASLLGCGWGQEGWVGMKRESVTKGLYPYTPITKQ